MEKEARRVAKTDERQDRADEEADEDDGAEEEERRCPERSQRKVKI